MTKICAWDIEIAAAIPQGANWDAYRPFGITCAAAWLFPDEQTVLWHDDYAPQMSPESCFDMAFYLWERQQEGYAVVTWNGGSFDFRCLAEEVNPEYFGDIVRIAMDHYDPALQMLQDLGFMCGLAAAAQGCQLGGKTMGGADAPIEWATGDRERQDKVLEYVEQDATITGQVYRQVLDRGRLLYYNKRYGTLCRWEPTGNAMLPVSKVPLLPAAAKPWRTYEESIAWMEK